MSKQKAMINLSSPFVKYAQQRANRSQKSFMLVPNVIGGLDVVPYNIMAIDDYADWQKPVAFVHPQPLDVQRATV